MNNITPKLTLLLGPAGSGKTHLVTDAFEAALKSSSDLLADDHLFILPTAEHRARVIDLVLRGGLTGFFQRRITTFDRALRDLLKLGGLDYATDVTRRMILKDILSRLEFRYFGDTARTGGFLELVSRAIVELKEYLIRPEELGARLEVLKKRFPEFALKYEDFAAIYAGYDEELAKRGLIDQRDSLRLLEEGLNRGEFRSPALKRVWIDGFSDFSKLQLAFVEFLTRHADEVTVTLTLDQDPRRAALFEIISETRARLEEMGFQAKWLEGENHRARNEELKQLERRLFWHGGKIKIASASHEAPPSATTAPLPRNDEKQDSPIQIFEATGLAGEMEMIAREIKRLVRAHGYHFSDIALLLRATDPYAQVIESVFRKFGIPFEMHERFRLKKSPLARTLASFLKILLEGWKREDLFNFLKSGCVRADYGLICDLELAALRKGIFKDRDYWLKTFPGVELLNGIARFEDELKAICTADQFAGWVRRLMLDFGMLRFPDSPDERTRRDRESAKRILLLLEEMKKKSRSQKEGSAFIEELLALMEVDLYSMHSRDKNKVQIYNVSLARQKEYKVVFLAGLLEKHFPIQVREDPLLSDAERRALNEQGEVLKERLPRQAFERTLFYFAVTRAREHLILTYPRFDLEGREALPSFYTGEAAAVFEGGLPVKKQPITEALPPWEEVATREEAECRVVQDIWSAPEEKPRTGEAHTSFAVYNALIHDAGFRGLIHRLLRPIEGVITDERIKPRLLPASGAWSATLLEEYAECPYRYFSHRLLHLESQMEGIDIRRRGTILHDVLQHFFTWQRDERGGKASFEEARDWCLKKFQELWKQEPLSGDRWYKIELERRQMEQMIVQILRVELVDQKPPIAGLVPRYFEYAFDGLTLKGDARGIPLRGKIDRIDTDPEGTYGLVIDYKSGKEFDAASLENGTSLQLPFYLIAAREKLGLKLLGGHLYPLSKGKSSGFHHKDHLAEAGLKTKKKNHYPEKVFDQVLERSTRFAERFVEEIERAQIPVRPRDCVSYCPYTTLCRIEKWRLERLYLEIAEEDKRQHAPNSAPTVV